MPSLAPSRLGATNLLKLFDLVIQDGCCAGRGVPLCRCAAVTVLGARIGRGPCARPLLAGGGAGPGGEGETLSVGGRAVPGCARAGPPACGCRRPAWRTGSSHAT